MGDDRISTIANDGWSSSSVSSRDTVSFPFDGRVSGLVDPSGVRLRNLRRLGNRIPTESQLDGLIQNGSVVLPPRYFRGHFLDLEV
ncbi:MAG: hypothetical protein QM523_07110 [Candidatus Pacebacteria bacterium]|nr:hypothetical protein [Candidatus Paceibacterota bacterium]